MIPLKIPEMPVIPVIAEDNTHIVIVSTNGGNLSLKKPISERWVIHLSPEGKTTGIQLKLKHERSGVTSMTSELMREEDKPACFGAYGYRSCQCARIVTPITSQCIWEERCFNSQRDS